ncbi:MAG: replication initiation protein, partial [Fusobacterium periodonticum]|nr:replication initiation protein [Fusobacterium periodonticum]
MNELKVVENKEEIVIYNNDLNTKVYLKKFNNFNWDIFMIVVSALAYTKNGVAEISLVEIKKKTNYTSQNNENFKNKLKETNRKILQSVCEIETGEDTEQFPLFKKFKIIGKKSLRVEVGEDYMSFFTDYSEYTSFGLKTFLTLKNKYTKPLFKELMQFKATGKAFFRTEDFRNKLDIPRSLSFSKIRDRILIPSIKDFSILFKNYKIIAKFLDGEEIEINENMSAEAKKDRRQVTNINFFFTISKKEDIITENEVVSKQAERLQTTNTTDEEEIDIKEEERLFNLDSIKCGLDMQISIAEEEIEMERSKIERYKQYIKQTKEAGAIDSVDEVINRDIISHYEFCIKEALEKIRSLEAEIVENKEEIEKIENEIGCNQSVSIQSSNDDNNDKKDIENKEEIDYLKLIKEFLKGQGIEYQKVETNINFLLENYTGEEIYREIIRINNIKSEKANINPKKYLIRSINNIENINNRVVENKINIVDDFVGVENIDEVD